MYVPTKCSLARPRIPDRSRILSKASRVIVTRAETLKPLPPTDDLVFGRHSTDHMMVASFHPKTGWSAPEIKPYGPLSLDPACSCFQYCTSVFEGMKAFAGPDGKPRLFRPNRNMERMTRSAARVALPAFNSDALLELIRLLVMIDSRWVPQAPGCSLYIRPTLIGTRPSLGVAPSDEAMLYVILSPTGPYFRTGSKPVRLLAVGEQVRSWPGGTAGYKLGINYPACFSPQREAAKKGYQQVLWLLGDGTGDSMGMKVTEAGSMNFFVVVKREDEEGVDVITPPLDGTILPGVTRESCITLLRSHSPVSPLHSLDPHTAIRVFETPFTLGDMYKWSSEDRLLEAFGAGTAAVISGVGVVGLDGHPDIEIPEYEGALGPVGKALYDRITDIQEGKVEFGDWSYPCA
ncbi:branched-chain amino acid aminotransferase II [Thelephora terrestris]|uniref:Branched-chain-amino-acid aminotransferase n=1 Tax=Thelephora terrestris TaxID=56493 RepID=A0A9P6H7L9_9AGAM|nr:branched-chain amino acid aminotransferase II [Thelephora terrestris]